MDLCATKQREGEKISSFLQRWRALYHKCLSHIPKVEQVDIFIKNLIPQVKYPVQMKCLNTFKEITKKGLKCENGLVEKGILKHQKDKGPTNNSSNEKPKFQSKNNNVTSDGVVDAYVVNKAQQVVSLQGPVDSFVSNRAQSQGRNTPSTNANAVQSGHQRPPRINTPRRNYTPLGEPIESSLKNLMQTNIITLPKLRPYEPVPFKITWWNDNDLCEYHHTKGHKTASCYKLKNLIQDLLNQGDIIMDANKGLANIDHTIFKDPFGKHDKRKSSILGTQNNTANYINVA